MNVLQNLIELYNHLSPDSTYRNVIRMILLHLEEAAGATIYDLAELTNSSRTTIKRLLDKLGYSGYSQFHEALRQAVRNYTYYNRMMPRQIRGESIVTELKDEMAAVSDAGSRDLSYPELEAMTECVRQKRKVLFFQLSSTAVHVFQQNLAIAGIETQDLMILPEFLQCLEDTGKDSLVFLRTLEYAETQDLTGIFRKMKEKGVTVILFGNPDSRYAEFIDRFLLEDSGKSGVIGNLILTDMYIFALNEVFRKRYID